ncbi:MAG: hypothetical protein ACR2RL_11750 [Gammaproteobacteria bacterium]
MIVFFAHSLFFLAAWTLVIKYAFPIAFALAEGSPLLTYVMWDFWWVAHIWLGWVLLNWQRYTFALAMIVSIVESAIVVTKFALFLSAPAWDIWHTNWFINKLFVLGLFCWMLAWLLLKSRSLRSIDPADVRAPTTALGHRLTADSRAGHLRNTTIPLE